MFYYVMIRLRTKPDRKITKFIFSPWWIIFKLGQNVVAKALVVKRFRKDWLECFFDFFFFAKINATPINSPN